MNKLMLAISAAVAAFSACADFEINLDPNAKLIRDIRQSTTPPVVGSCGVMYRVIAEGIKDHPIILQHGTSKEAGTEDTFFTSARVTDQVYARRRALKEGKRGKNVVAKRFCSSGMFWSGSGLDAMLPLRAIIKSGRYVEFWKYTLREKRQIRCA